jgi:hypothetical protein
MISIIGLLLGGGVGFLREYLLSLQAGLMAMQGYSESGVTVPAIVHSHYFIHFVLFPLLGIGGMLTFYWFLKKIKKFLTSHRRHLA